MNPRGIRPGTLEKYLKVKKLMERNPDLEHKIIYERVGISMLWFKEVDRRMKESEK